MNKHYIGIIGAILAGTVLIAGSILYTGPKNEEILSLQKTKKRKKKENPLLRPPTGECQGWAFYVPRCFNAALDITFNASRKGRRAL